MAHTSKREQIFEEAFDRIAIATWNRPRTNAELKDFVQRHHDALLDVDLEV